MQKQRLEKAIVADIREYLVNEVGATCHKHHGNAYSERGLPDLFGTLPGGRAFYIEVKRPGKLATLTPAQRLLLQQEAKNGAVAGYATSVEDVVDLLMQQGFKVIPPEKRVEGFRP
jgi:hypothetical protein